MRSLKTMTCMTYIAALLMPALALADGYNDDHLTRSQRLQAFDHAQGTCCQDTPRVIYIETIDDGELKVDLSADEAEIAMAPTAGELKAKKKLKQVEQASAELNELAALRQQMINADMAQRESFAARERDLAERERRLHSEIEQKATEQFQLMNQQLELNKEEAQLINERNMLDPLYVKQELISVNFKAATLKEMMLKILPKGWEVDIDIHNDPGLEERRSKLLITETPREVAIQKILSGFKGVRLNHGYFWDVVDEQGKPAPTLLIADHQIN
ncbi:MAG: hypothetical protein V3T17_16435 [Pseudomonadales bacterium]